MGKGEKTMYGFEDQMDDDNSERSVYALSVQPLGSAARSPCLVFSSVKWLQWKDRIEYWLWCLIIPAYGFVKSDIIVDFVCVDGPAASFFDE